MATAFHYEKGQLVGEEMPLSRIAAAVGTPVYVYSQAALVERAAAYVQAAQQTAARCLVCFAVKANGNPALLRLLGEQGLGADLTSGGELFLAQFAGIPPHRLLFSGVGKTSAEIQQALQAGIRALHVESWAEMERIAGIAQTLQMAAPVAVRLNPDVAADTHPAIHTGGRQHKFGVNAQAARQMLLAAADHPWLSPVGLAAHIGSQIRELAPFRQATAALLRLAADLEAVGCRLQYLDVGGGLGLDSISQAAPRPAEWVAAVGEPVAQAGYELVLEPGRSLVGDAGILLTRVEYVKEEGGKWFVVVDAGMNDFLRPALYGGEHPIWPVALRSGRQRESRADHTWRVEVVGPVCESGDTLARDYELPPVAAGDLLAVMQAGAYGYAMSSNYNGRLRPPEVLISGAAYQIIRQRQTMTHLLG